MRAFAADVLGFAADLRGFVADLRSYSADLRYFFDVLRHFRRTPGRSWERHFLTILPPREEACRQLKLFTCRHRPKRSCLNQSTDLTVGVR